MNIERLVELDASQIREVYAMFGLAMYQANCLERQVAIMLAIHYARDSTSISEEELSTIYEGLFSKTFGQLVKEIETLALLCEEEQSGLSHALVKRNKLAHRYFWERAIEFLSEAGRSAMIEELEDDVHFMDTLDGLLTNRTLEWCEKVGITEDMVDEQLERLIRGLDDYQVGHGQ